jgi:hypothetical protein
MAKGDDMRYVTVLFVALAVLAMSCDSGATDTTVAATASTTTAVSTTGVTEVIPTTITTTIAGTVSTTAISATDPSIREPLVLVAFGDSVISYTPTLLDTYSEFLEEEFGVPVDVRNHTDWGSSPTRLLSALGSEYIQADLADADVVLLEIPQGDTNPAFPMAIGWHGMDPADCGGDDSQQCLRDYVTQNKEDVELILWILTGVHEDGSVPLVRVFDMYMMHVEDSLALGKLHILNPYFQETQQYLDHTAGEYGIPVAQVYAEFMGPDGTDDPQDRGLVMSDQRHPTAKGAQLIAEMLNDLGFNSAD